MPEIVVAKARVGPIVGARWAVALAAAAVSSVAGVEAAHWRAVTTGAGEERLVQMPAPVATPAQAAEVSGPDPGDEP